jgi:hypothetical protein
MKSILWLEWSKAFSELRDAFSRTSTFLWAAILCVDGYMVLLGEHS